MNSFLPTVYRIETECDLAEARESCRKVRFFLDQLGFPEEESSRWELVLVEAANNAVKYASVEGSRLPITIEASCIENKLEIRIIDHTHGFEYPAKASLADPYDETGRGIFIIQTIVDRSEYFMGKSSNSYPKRIRQELDRGSEADQELGKQLFQTEETLAAMAEELSSCYESLTAIFRFSSELNVTRDTASFAEGLLKHLIQITDSDWYRFRLYDPDEALLIILSDHETNSNQAPLPFPRTDEDDLVKSLEIDSTRLRQDIWFDVDKPIHEEDSLFRSVREQSGIVHPFFMNETLIGVLTVGKNQSENVFTAAQINILHTFSDFLTIHILNTRFQEEKVRSHVVSRELEIATNIQRSLLPRQLPELSGFSISGSCTNAHQVGGDFFDMIPCSNHSALLVIADVMGKGIPAALFAAILRALIRAMPQISDSPGKLMSWVNNMIFDDLSKVEMFITAQFVFVDTRSNYLVASNAGHCPLLAACANGGNLNRITSEDMPLGIMRNLEYEQTRMELNDCRKILLYTDGLPEAQNPEGEFFSEKRLQEWLLLPTLEESDAMALGKKLIETIKQFQREAMNADDQTFLLLLREN